LGGGFPSVFMPPNGGHWLEYDDKKRIYSHGNILILIITI